MSLQVWLPLNGNLNNQGLCGDAIITNNNNTSINDSGKIGKCYSFNGTDNYLSINKTSLNLFPYDGCGWSLSSWVYCEAAPTVQTGIITCNSYQICGCGMGFRTNRKFVGMIMGSGVSVEYEFNYIIPVKEWHHICITFDDTLKVMVLYVDGQKHSTSGQVSFDWVRNNLAFTIGKNTQGGWGGYFNGKLNDCRIYDHCLSAKEVKEISKGLVLHYKLDNCGWGNKNLLPNTHITENTVFYPTTNYSDRNIASVKTDILNGSTYTVSFEAKSTHAGDKIRIHFYNPSNITSGIGSQGQNNKASDGNMDFTLSDKWEMCYF